MKALRPSKKAGEKPTTRRENGTSAGEIALEDGSLATADKPLVAKWEVVPDNELARPRGLEKMSLPDLAERINARLGTIESAIFNARNHATTALKAAIETGHYLEQSKRLCPKGQWGTWREKHCPGLSQATSYRYMGLPQKFSHVINGAEIHTLRQAYVAVGLLPDPSSEGKPPRDLSVAPAPSPTDVLSGVQSSRDFLGSVRNLPFETMAPEVLDRLEDELSELGTLCSELKEQIASARPISAKVSEKKAPGDKKQAKGGKRG